MTKIVHVLALDTQINSGLFYFKATESREG